MEDKNGVVQEVIYDLEELTLDQLRKFCNQLNCAGYALAPKFKCRRLLAVHINSVELYNQDWNTHSASAVSKKLNSDLRKVNAFFHKEVYENILNINRLMTRADHEDGTTDKDTYCSLAELYNKEEPDFLLDDVDSNLQTDVGKHLTNNSAFCDADLTQFVPTTVDGKCLKKFIREMFSLRKKNKGFDAYTNRRAPK
jgi:hypothetical protein